MTIKNGTTKMQDLLRMEFNRYFYSKRNAQKFVKEQRGMGRITKVSKVKVPKVESETGILWQVTVRI